MRVILAFRDSRRKGKSIEGIFKHLLIYSTREIELIAWEYNDDISLRRNVRGLNELKGDIIHITGDILYVALFIRRSKVIVTIHDIGRYKELRHLKKQIYKWWWIKLPARWATQITVVSTYTLNDVLRLIPSSRNKVRVIPNGIYPGLKAVTKPFKGVKPNILQVGTSPNKNIETVIHALQGLECTLTIIGSLTKEHKEQLQVHKVPYVNYEDLDMESLRLEYEKCDLVVFVSLHEGFGMPVIEAQMVGRPVITSKAASIPEVAQDGALYVANPLDVNELKIAITTLIKDQGLRDRLIEAGLQNAQKYSYEVMANKYLQLYKEVAAL